MTNKLALETRTMEIRKVDTEARTVTGIAVPYDTPTELAGYYTEVIERGAVRAAENVKLFWEHSEVIGRVVSHRETEEGWEITAHISETPRGNEAYTLLKDGVIDRFSIGFRPVEERFNEEEETVYRTIIDVLEVSLVPFPAYDGAKVQDVRAAVNQKTETGEKKMDKSIDELRGMIEELERRLSLMNSRGAEGGDMFRSFGHFIKAVVTGDEKANRAYEGAITGDTVIKDAWLNNLVKLADERQLVASRFQRGTLPSTGNFVEYALLKSDTTQVGVQTAEGEDLPFGKVALQTKNAEVKTLGGWSSMSRQSIERANISVLETTWRALYLKYLRAVENLARAALNGVTATTGVVADFSTQDKIVETLLNDVERFDGAGNKLDGYFVGKDVFLAMLAVPATDRVLQISSNGDAKQLGSFTVTSLQGEVANIPFTLMPNATASYVRAYDSSALMTLESPGAPVRLTDNNIVNLTNEFSLYGYAASFVQLEDGILRPETVTLV